MRFLPAKCGSQIYEFGLFLKQHIEKVVGSFYFCPEKIFLLVKSFLFLHCIFYIYNYILNLDFIKTKIINFLFIKSCFLFILY